MSGWLRLLIDSVFPLDCEVCDAPLPPGHPQCVCDRCWAAMRPLPRPLCPTCGAPQTRGVPDADCPSCLLHPPAFHRARAAALYLPASAGLNPLAVAVQRLKYDGRRPLAAALGALLAARYPFGEGAVLLPVPLHPRRLRARGYNQALLLARVLGRARALPVIPRLLRRTHDTRAQTGLGAAERRRNLAEAFALSAAHTIRGAHVVLVDDVLTTGATADACARVLRHAGARRIDVYTLGRALVPRPSGLEGARFEG
jgi:ComF family protein